MPHNNHEPITKAGETSSDINSTFPHANPHEQGLSNISVYDQLGSLVLGEDTVLREHQIAAFEDLIDAFKEGVREAFEVLPTSAGKTVIYVETARLLIESAERGMPKRRVLVLEPTRDLVNQTVGSIDPHTGKKRGFRGFAAKLNTQPYHSNINNKQREQNIAEADVVVTTYNSFRNLMEMLVTGERKSDEQWQEELNSQFKILETSDEDRKKRRNIFEDFLKEKYYVQEVANIRAVANKLLAEPSEPVSPMQKKVLENILQRTTVRQPELAKDILRKIASPLRFVARSNPRVKNTIHWMRECDTIAVANLRLSDDEKLGIPENPVGELTEFELMVVNFLYENYADRSVNRMELKSPSERKKAEELKDQASDAIYASHYAKSRIEAIVQILRVRNALRDFGLIILDEAHRAIGSETYESIREFASRRDIAIAGFTATDEYEDRSVADYFQNKVHELTKEEAQDRGIINPVAFFAHETGLDFSDIMLAPNGDYDRYSMRAMRFNHTRNRTIVNYARILSELGYFGLVSCIPGDSGEHAKLIAEQINATEMVDPITGETRLMRAAYVLQDQNNKTVYEMLERTEIDWISFIDVIREGYDSDVAKALINGRDTLSKLLATQRIGRVCRTYPGAPTSIVIDLHDNIRGQGEGNELPQVLGMDVYELEEAEQGHVVGNQADPGNTAIEALKLLLPGKMTGRYTRHKRILKTAINIDDRGIAYKQDRSRPDYNLQTQDSIIRSYGGFLPRRILAEALAAEPPLVRSEEGNKNGRLVKLLNINDVRDLQEGKPEINPWKLIEIEGEKWISSEGCVQMLSKKFPGMIAEDINDAVQKAEQELCLTFSREIAIFQNTRPGRTDGHKAFTFIYKFEEIKDMLVPYLTNQV